MQSWTRKGTHTKSLRRKRSKLFHYAPKLWPLHSSPPHFLSSFTTQRKSYKRNPPKIHQQHSTISLSSLSQNTPYYARSIRSPGLPHLIPSLMILSFLHRRNQPTKTLTLRIAPIYLPLSIWPCIRERDPTQNAEIPIEDPTTTTSEPSTNLQSQLYWRLLHLH